jgi:hypothetical protein
MKTDLQRALDSSFHLRDGKRHIVCVQQRFLLGFVYAQSPTWNPNQSRILWSGGPLHNNLCPKALSTEELYASSDWELPTNTHRLQVRNCVRSRNLSFPEVSRVFVWRTHGIQLLRFVRPLETSLFKFLGANRSPRAHLASPWLCWNTGKEFGFVLHTHWRTAELQSHLRRVCINVVHYF